MSYNAHKAPLQAHSQRKYTQSVSQKAQCQRQKCWKATSQKQKYSMNIKSEGSTAKTNDPEGLTAKGRMLKGIWNLYKRGKCLQIPANI